MSYDIKPWLWQYALDIIKKYNMDESHGIQHFINVRIYAMKLLESEEIKSIKNLIPDYNVNRSQIEDLILDAAFAHDLIDSKYATDDAVNDLRKVFLDNNYDMIDLEIIIYIISNISYSKRTKRLHKGLPLFDTNSVKINDTVIKAKSLQLVTHIVCDADQLDGYDVNRCVLYQTMKYKHLPEPGKSEMINGWCKTIFVKRILKYKEYHMYTNTAKILAIPLHDMVKAYVDTYLKDVIMFEYD